MALAIVPFLQTPSAKACLHAEAKMYGPTTRTDVFALSQKGQQALIIHHEGHEDLVMAFEVSASAPLSSLAWIIPVPSVPDSYGTASPNLLGAVAKWTSLRRVVTRRMNIRAKGRGASPAAASPTSQALQVLPTAEAGPYAIQPLKATGNAGVAALGKWMKDNGFVPLEKDKLSYYVERNWTFLAVRIQPADGAKAISDKGLLPPLRMRFASARAVYPLKLSTHQGVFPVRVDIVTKEPLPKGAFKGAKKRGFEVAGAKGAVYQSAPGAAAGTLLSNVHAFDTAKAPAELRKELARVKLDGEAPCSHALRKSVWQRRREAGGLERRSCCPRARRWRTSRGKVQGAGEQASKDEALRQGQRYAIRQGQRRADSTGIAWWVKLPRGVCFGIPDRTPSLAPRAACRHVRLATPPALKPERALLRARQRPKAGPQSAAPTAMGFGTGRSAT
jgi:hypothetical protein